MQNNYKNLEGKRETLMDNLQYKQIHMKTIWREKISRVMKTENEKLTTMFIINLIWK